MTSEELVRINRAKQDKHIKNKRNIPTGEDILKDRSFDMKTFIKLQIESYWNEGVDEHRYIKISDINYTRWSKEIGTNPKTLKKNIQLLVLAGFISKYTGDDGEQYYKIKNHFEGFLLFPECFARKLLTVNSKNLIKAYLIYYKYSNTYGSCQIAQKELLAQMGFPYDSTSCKMIKDINDTLVDQGLVDVERNTIREGNKTKTYLKVVAHHYLDTEFYKKATAPC